MFVELRHPAGSWILGDGREAPEPDDTPQEVSDAEAGARLVRPLLQDPLSRRELRGFLDRLLPGQPPLPSDDRIAAQMGAVLASGRGTLARRPRPVTSTPVQAATGGSPAAPAKPPPVAAAPAALAPFKAFSILRLEFLTDHRLLLDNAATWKNGGTKLQRPDWTPKESHPVSHSMDLSVEVRIVIQLGPEGASEQEVTLRGSGGGLTFEATFQGKPGENSVELKSTERLPRKLQVLEPTLKWTLTPAEGKALPPKSMGLKIFVTYGPPRDIIHDEFSPTLKRMDWSVRKVASFGTVDPHEIVAKLHGLVDGYTLSTDKSVPAKFHHPDYFNEEGGPWPMVERFDKQAECQAIVRLIRGVLWMLGVPGEARAMLVFADPTKSPYPVVEESLVRQRLEKEPGGLQNVSREVKTDAGTVIWFAALTDDPVVEGQLYPADSHSQTAEGGLSPGFNSFEACLRFIDDEKHVTKYYGGGAGAYATKEDVIKAFNQLVWMSEVNGPKGKSWKIEKILKTYR